MIAVFFKGTLPYMGILLLFSFVMVFVSFFKFLRWKANPKVNAVIKKLQNKAYRYEKPDSDKVSVTEYTYQIEVQGDSTQEIYKYVEAVSSEGKSKLQPGETYAFYIDEDTKEVKLAKQLADPVIVWLCTFAVSVLYIVLVIRFINV